MMVCGKWTKLVWHPSFVSLFPRSPQFSLFTLLDKVTVIILPCHHNMQRKSCTGSTVYYCIYYTHWWKPSAVCANPEKTWLQEKGKRNFQTHQHHGVIVWQRKWDSGHFLNFWGGNTSHCVIINNVGVRNNRSSVYHGQRSSVLLWVETKTHSK